MDVQLTSPHTDYLETDAKLFEYQLQQLKDFAIRLGQKELLLMSPNRMELTTKCENDQESKQLMQWEPTFYTQNHDAESITRILFSQMLNDKISSMTVDSAVEFERQLLAKKEDKEEINCLSCWTEKKRWLTVANVETKC